MWPAYRSAYKALIKIGAERADAEQILIRTARSVLDLTPIKARQWVYGHLTKDFPL